jgi:hypothetical protein
MTRTTSDSLRIGLKPKAAPPKWGDEKPRFYRSGVLRNERHIKRRAIFAY